MKKLFTMLLPVMILSCAPKGSYTVINEVDRPPTTSDKVAVITTQVTRPYMEIAIVEAQKAATSTFGNPTLNDVIPELRKQAAALGADAIINVQSEAGRGAGSWRNVKSIKATATAVVWTD